MSSGKVIPPFRLPHFSMYKTSYFCFSLVLLSEIIFFCLGGVAANRWALPRGFWPDWVTYTVQGVRLPSCLRFARGSTSFFDTSGKTILRLLLFGWWRHVPVRTVFDRQQSETSCQVMHLLSGGVGSGNRNHCLFLFSRRHERQFLPFDELQRWTLN